MVLHLRAIGCLCILGNNLNLVIGFEVDEDRRRFQFRLYLLRVENMKQHDIVAMEAKRLDNAHDRLRLFIEIRDHNDDAAPVQQCLEMTQRFTVVGSCARLCLFKSREEARELALPRRWSYIFPDLVVENNQSCSVSLISDRQIED